MDNVMSLGNTIHLGPICRHLLIQFTFWADAKGFIPYPYAYFSNNLNMTTLRRAIKVLEGRDLLHDHQLNVAKIKTLADKFRAENPARCEDCSLA
jgi:hypothetical protein